MEARVEMEVVRVPVVYLSLCFPDVVWVSEPPGSWREGVVCICWPTLLCRSEGSAAVGDGRVLVEVDY